MRHVKLVSGALAAVATIWWFGRRGADLEVKRVNGMWLVSTLDGRRGADWEVKRVNGMWLVSMLGGRR